MEVLVPVVIVTIGIGLLLVFLRRPTVVRPPTDTGAPKSPTSTPTSNDPMQKLLDDMNIDMSVGGKHITLKGNQKIGWTLIDGLDKTTIPAEILRRVIVKEGTDPLTDDLLARLTLESFPDDAPPPYPGSSVVVSSFERRRTSGGAAESGDVYKVTFATDADGAQVLAWYRDWFASHGWQVSPSTGTSAESPQEFTRSSEHLRLAVADPATVTSILAVPIPAGTKTIYELEYSNSSTSSTTA